MNLRKAITEGTSEDWLEVCDFKGKGRGVRALKRFTKEEFIVEYKGAFSVFPPLSVWISQWKERV